MKPRIETLPEKKIIGKHLQMSLANNQTFELWRSFMPERGSIKNKLSSDLYSIQVYDNPSYFKNFDPNAEFTKWAGEEVADFSMVPDGMSTFILKSGLYAVFEYKGLSTDTRIFQYIYGEWLPNNAEYRLDDRPHFEILGEKYKNNDPESEEDIWMPIKPIKTQSHEFQIV